MADFLGLMKQAAELKSKMETMQAELDQVEVEGTSGGGLVTIKLTGKGEMKGVTIDDSLLKPSEKEVLEDLVIAAHADARRKAEAVMQEKMQIRRRRIAAAARTEIVLDRQWLRRWPNIRRKPSDGEMPWMKISIPRRCRPRSRDFWPATS